MSIQDELHRIAERAPVVEVPADTWARGRRARTRERVAVLAGALAVGLLAAVLVWVPTRSEPPVADTDSLGVPDRLWAVPERMSSQSEDGTWTSDEVSDDATVGTGAAAWVSSWGLPVVVGAADGAYHLLDIPDFVGNSWASLAQGSTVLALSPDGRRLAYAYAVLGPDSATEPIPSGVRVLDLGTGEMQEIPVPGKEGTAIHQLEWSPDGRWLAFTGMQQDTWTEMSMGSRGPAVLGRIAPGATEAETREVMNHQAPMAISDDGSVQWRAGEVHVWGAGPALPRALDALGRLPDGRWLRRTGTANNDVLSVRDSRTGRRHVLVQLYGVDGSVSIATDLMSPDRLTVARPEPDWPWSDERKVVVSLLVAVGTATLVVLLVTLTRRRPR